MPPKALVQGRIIPSNHPSIHLPTEECLELHGDIERFCLHKIAQKRIDFESQNACIIKCMGLCGSLAHPWPIPGNAYIHIAHQLLGQHVCLRKPLGKLLQRVVSRYFKSFLLKIKNRSECREQNALRTPTRVFPRFSN